MTRAPSRALTLFALLGFSQLPSTALAISAADLRLQIQMPPNGLWLPLSAPAFVAPDRAGWPRKLKGQAFAARWVSAGGEIAPVALQVPRHFQTHDFASVKTAIWSGVVKFLAEEADLPNGEPFFRALHELHRDAPEVFTGGNEIWRARANELVGMWPNDPHYRQRGQFKPGWDAPNAGRTTDGAAETIHRLRGLEALGESVSAGYGHVATVVVEDGAEPHARPVLDSLGRWLHRNRVAGSPDVAHATIQEWRAGPEAYGHGTILAVSGDSLPYDPRGHDLGERPGDGTVRLLVVPAAAARRVGLADVGAPGRPQLPHHPILRITR